MAEKEYYRDNINLKRPGVQYEFTKEQIDEYLKCAEDPIYFIKNYMKIISLDRGIINFEMYDYQEELIKTFIDNRRTCVRSSRQSGKTTTTVAFMLWMTIFNEHYSIAITANKKSLSTEILSRYQLAYESLPMWLQQGVVVWNKGSVELENGSKILAAATSASAVRGGTFNCCILDEFAHVHNNLAEEFFTSTYPVISSGKNSKLIIISTPRGMNLFYKIWTEAVSGKNGYAYVDVNWRRIPGRDEKFKEDTIKATSQRQWNQEFESCSYNTLININSEEIKIGELYDRLSENATKN